MKYIVSIVFAFSFFCFSIVFVEAGVIVTNQKHITSFETRVGEINRIGKTKDIKFDIAVSNIVSPENIEYWKIRTYCDKDMSIRYGTSTSSMCGKAFNIKELNSNMFSFLFTNNTNDLKSFSVKLKAYNKNGKWLYTEKESFRWK